MKPNVKTREKSSKLYIFLRVFWLFAFAGGNAAALGSMIVALKTGETVWVALAMPAAMLLIPPCVFMTFSVGAFSFDYSVFGRYRRTPWPDEAPIAERRYTWGRAKWLNATVPFFDWVLFPSGLGFSIRLIGKGFIPLEDIISVTRRPSSHRVHHSSPEVRSPLSFRDEKIYEQLVKKLEASPVRKEKGER